jgi:O-antigen ligase
LVIPEDLRDFVSNRWIDQISAHNSYMLLLAETGLIGTIPMSILLLVLIIKGFDATKALLNEGAYWYLGIYASFIAMTIHLWSIAGIGNTIVWIVYGLVISGIQIRHYQSSEQSEQRA